MDWTAIAVIVNIVVTLILAGIGYGVLKSQVAYQGKRSDINEKVVSNNRDRLEDKIEHQSHVMLPDCQRCFMELKEGIGEIKGGMNTMVSLFKDKK